jgi:uncharacterized membrane protein
MNNNLLQLLRFVHIVSASAWVGIAVTLGFFISPAILTGDAAGSRLIKRIMFEKKLGIYLPLIVILAIASGAWLYRIDFPNMTTATFSKRALDYTLGAFLGIVAFIVGVTVNLPTGRKLVALGDAVGSGTPTVEQSNEMVKHSRRLLISGRSTAILALGAAALMALARYAF